MLWKKKVNLLPRAVDILNLIQKEKLVENSLSGKASARGLSLDLNKLITKLMALKK